MPRIPKRRFLDLEVDEVSVVDSPANEIQFLVTKNLEEEDEMPRQAADGAKSVERVAIENPGNAQDESVAKAMEHVHGIIKDITGLANRKSKGNKVRTKKAEEAETQEEEAEEAEEPDEADDDEADAGEGEDEDESQDDEENSDDGEKEGVEKGKGHSLRGLLKTLGISGAALKKAEAKLKAKGLALDARIGGSVPTKKAAAASAPLESGDDPTLEMLEQAIRKAKRFTPDRVKKLQEAHDILKLVLESVAQGTSPRMDTIPLKPAAYASLMKPKGQLDRAVFKSEAAESASEDPLQAILETVKEGFEGIKKSIENLNERTEKNEEAVQAIKSARPTSNSLDGSVTEKTKKSTTTGLWSGVL